MLLKMNTLIIVVSVLLLLSVAIAKDVPYLQEVSFKTVYSDVEAAPPDPQTQTGFVSTAWSQMPFPRWKSKEMTKRNTVIAAGKCMVALNQGKLFGMSENTAPLHEAPYTAWALLGDTGISDVRAMVYMGDSKNGTILYMPTTDNIARVLLSEPSADLPCGKISDVSLLLDDNNTQTWGIVSGVQYSPSMDTLFIGSVDRGVYVVNLRTDKVSVLTHVDVAGDSSSTLLWVEKWKTLYTANNLAFYTLKFCPKKQALVDADHEWIGGILAFTPTDLDYDSVNDVVWIAENECIHKLTQDATYWRMGYQQGAPMFNISSVAVNGGQVFSGSINLGMARVSGAQSAAQLDMDISINAQASSSSPVPVAATGADGDPWSWIYYYGPRWLPSNEVYAIIPTAQKDRKSVVVVTSLGMTVMNVGEMTLKEKAAVQETFQEPRHDRHGLCSEVHLDSPGDLSTYHKAVTDNDGLWTSMSAMGAAYRYMSTKEEAARESAWKMFEGLERLSLLTGDYPHFTARSFSKVSDGDMYLPTELDPTCVDDCWYASPTDSEYWYKGDTSSDELCGHMAIYPLLLDHVAKTPEEKERVLAILDGLMGNIVDNDLYFIQPATGKRTLWGFWNPKELNHEPEHYSERGTNSLEILSWLAQIFSVTGKEKYQQMYWKLVNDHKYIQNTINVKIDSAIDENHSDTELIMLTYHSLFYAYERLPDGHERKEAVWAMVKPLIPSLQRTFFLLKGELSPLWLGIYAGTAAQRRYLTEKDVNDAVFTLRHWQMDNIDWNIRGTQRIDVDIAYAFLMRNSNDKNIMRHIRPPQERRSSEWNNDPFAVNPNSDNASEYEPGTFLLPYYIMLYHGLI